MSGLQSKDTALKTKETTNETATTIATKTTVTIAKKTLTSSEALSLFDQLKNGVNLNSLTEATTATTTTTTTTTATTTATVTANSVATLAPPAAPPNIDLKPPLQPPKSATTTTTTTTATLARPFSTPTLLPPTSSVGIVLGTKRGRGETATTTKTTATVALSPSATAAAKLDINALRSQLYQSARKTATTTTKIATRTTATTTTKATTRGDRVRAGNGNNTKKRCLDRCDSSESSDSSRASHCIFARQTVVPFHFLSWLGHVVQLKQQHGICPCSGKANNPPPQGDTGNNEYVSRHPDMRPEQVTSVACQALILYTL
ncbi:hypothetical protein ACLKA7_014043 [Drosophila subpalustris]